MSRKKIKSDRSIAGWFTNRIFALSDDVRYVAVYRNGKLESVSKPNLEGATWWESDKYEEIIVNPTLITLLRQRGSIDRGGVQYIVIQYGDFTQFVSPIQGGHLSIGFEPGSDYSRILPGIARLVKSGMAEAGPR